MPFVETGGLVTHYDLSGPAGAEKQAQTPVQSSCANQSFLTRAGRTPGARSRSCSPELARMNSPVS